MNYDIRTEELTRSLPVPLRNDPTEFAMAKAVAAQLRINAKLAKKAVLYARIDTLDEPMIDALAQDMHVDWYDGNAPLNIKRQVVKDSVKIHKKLGTVWAVEQVIATYFGYGEVEEWFDYGGEPYHFRIHTTNLSVSEEQQAQFFRILEIVKRKSAWLDEIILSATLGMSVSHSLLPISGYERQRVSVSAQFRLSMPHNVSILPITSYERATIVLDTSLILPMHHQIAIGEITIYERQEI